MNQIIIIAYNSNPADYFYICPQFFFKLSFYCSKQIFTFLYTTTGRFDQCDLSEVIISPGSYKIELSVLIINNRSGNIPVMVNIIQWPLCILQIHFDFCMHCFFSLKLNFSHSLSHLYFFILYLICTKTSIIHYQIFMICCMIRLTAVIPHQHDAPIRIGFPPVLISLITLLFNPIAAIAIIIINFDNSFIG